VGKVKLDNENLVIGHPDDFWYVGLVYKEGDEPEKGYSELPMVELLPLEKPDGSYLNICIMRVFETEQDAKSARDYVSDKIISNEIKLEAIDYTICQDKITNLSVLKDKLLKSISELESEKDPSLDDTIPHKLCITKCAFTNGKIKELEVLFQNVHDSKVTLN